LFRWFVGLNPDDPEPWYVKGWADAIRRVSKKGVVLSSTQIADLA
jgi:hypothetical protein